MELMPLVKSAEYDDVEGEFKALFLSLYKQFVDAQVSEVAMYGMPQIGPSSLIERHVSGDGLAVMTNTTEDRIRYLFHAWRYRNPQRGTAFLRAYLNTLFGPVFTIDQMWCPKNGVYPDDVRDSYEMATSGANYDDYFLTSRLRVDIETKALPEKVVAAARTALAARMVLEMRIASRISWGLPVALVAHGLTISRMTSIPRYIQREVMARESAAWPMSSGSATVVRSRATSSKFMPKVVHAQSTVVRPMSSGRVTLVRTRSDG
ncbi:hypothetical protein AB4P95_29945 (plasmid) [Pseudomonas sp. A1437]|uniref:hypothetical protein n=1 Tax=Pseudomonas sp. A1437 TaxID=3235107 RepID=UPI0037848D81